MKSLGVFLTILLLASPALSFSALAGFAFLPNEKLATMFLITNRASWKKKYKNVWIICVIASAILSFLFTLQIIFNNTGIFQSSVNSIIIIASIPLYYSYFSSNYSLVCRAIFYVAVLQFLISITQQYFVMTGSHEAAGMFNNYSYQSNYVFPRGETGFFYRTSGLFTESSSYALFQWLAIVCAIKVGLHKRLLIKILLIIMTLEVIINGALTGYAFILGFVGIDFLSKFRYKKTLIRTTIGSLILLFTFALMKSYGYFDVSGLFLKITKQFAFIENPNSAHPSRLMGLIQAIELTLSSNFILWGSGFSWNTPTLDIYSLYLKAYGVIGVIVILFMVILLLQKAPLNYRVAVLLALSINGHLSTTINILLITMACAMYKINQSSGDDK